MIPNKAHDFPNLPDPINQTSPATDSYNCIAWAAGDSERWWQPDPFGLYYWPEDAQKTFSIAGLISAYEALDYVLCDHGLPEVGCDKIALFADHNGDWTHAARQLPDGRWTSKMGSGIDLTHDTPEQLSGPLYGQAVRFMKRDIA